MLSNIKKCRHLIQHKQGFHLLVITFLFTQLEKAKYSLASELKCPRTWITWNPRTFLKKFCRRTQFFRETRSQRASNVCARRGRSLLICFCWKRNSLVNFECFFLYFSKNNNCNAFVTLLKYYLFRYLSVTLMFKFKEIRTCSCDIYLGIHCG